ncbi:citrate synthase [Luteipulveratus halotolerans]|uniref:citrate synthase (unknown stereospecificity) n=1 Tax=Luteipulveratus halotolerans TaxID=1631356 RepID=A0A0L6CH44_9MICO|nr:citrate synthase [Luteipulveratus halotolerans]KNX36915.1 hypothetical protein VV01_06735 [Luteipulveratus halotolerans]
MSTPELIPAAAAADLLGVRRQTLYAYVSRGILTRSHATDDRGHRVSMFDRREVLALTERHRRDRTGVFELHLDTAVTHLDPAGRLLYRGRDACDLALTHSFEAVAEILWDTSSSGDWDVSDEALWVWQHLDAACPADAMPAARVRVALAMLAACTAGPDRPSPSDVRRLARVAVMTAAGALGRPTAPWPGSVALAASRALSPTGDRAASAIGTALVLLADHELATSTVAARAAASTHADPVVTFLTGAAAMGGPLHGRAGEAAYALLRDAATLGAAAALDRRGERTPPGFGHAVYTDTDPRAECLLDVVLDGQPHLSDTIDDLSLQVRRRHGLAMNVDLAMAAATMALPLRPGAAEGIFVVARLAGMAAHALEELEHRLRFRPRAVYTGESSG